MEVADESTMTKKYRSKECELCTDDDEEVRVSVSPRRFTLPSSVDKNTRMEIVNRNPYPIYFRACTSNMDAFRMRPNAGRISPNTKAPIFVHFFNTVTPVRHHEEVVIVTSVRPFEQCAIQDNVCQYCLQPMNGTKHDHHRKYPFASDEDQYTKEKSYHSDNKNLPTRQKEDADQYLREKSEPLDYKNYSTRQKDEEDQYVREKSEPLDYKGYSTRQKDEREQYAKEKSKPPEYKSYSTRQKEEEDQNIRDKSQPGEYKSYATRPKYEEERKYASGLKREQATPDISGRYFQTVLPKQISNGHQEGAREQTCKNLSSNGKPELEEICLHAFVHRPAHGGCNCGKCFDLSMTDRNELKVKEIFHALKEQRVLDPEAKQFPTLSQREEATLAKEMQKLRDRTVDESKLREREAHILARIIRARDWVESTTSDTELSEFSSSRDLMVKPLKHRRIISEEQFRKKLERAKFKKHQKRLEEESKSTTTTEDAAPKMVDKKADSKSEQPTLSRKQRKWTIVAVEERCNEILRLSWTNFFLLLCIFVTLLAILAFCCSGGGSDGGMYHFRCFYDLFN